MSLLTGAPLYDVWRGGIWLEEGEAAKQGCAQHAQDQNHEEFYEDFVLKKAVVMERLVFGLH